MEKLIWINSPPDRARTLETNDCGAADLSILKSGHAVMANGRTPLADLGCMRCHGSSKAHEAAGGNVISKTNVDSAS